MVVMGAMGESNPGPLIRRLSGTQSYSIPRLQGKPSVLI